MDATSLCFCIKRKNKVSPGDVHLDKGTKVQTIRGVTQERFVLPAVHKMPPFIRKLVLGEFNGSMHIPSPRLGIPLVFLSGIVFIILGNVNK